VARAFELTVPDIGDFRDVPVIEVLIEAGQAVSKDATVVTLESDKATMEVPSPEDGIVKDVLVKLGDKVSQGTLLARLEAPASAGADAPASVPPAAAAIATPSPAAPAAAQNGAARPAVPGDSTSIELLVPDIGNFDDVPVIEVLVAVGDTIAKDAPLISLESDKATMEVPSDAAGTVTAVHVKIGDKVSQGTRVATLAVAPADAPAAPPSPAAPAPTAAATAATSPAPPSPPPSAGTPAPEATNAPAVPSSYGASGSPAASNGAATVHASPSIRRFARELGVRLGDVEGTSRNGRITREDVQAFVKARLNAAPAPAPREAAGKAEGLTLDLPAWPKVDFERFGPVERKALSRIQRLSGPALARNWVMIPHVTNNDEADVTELEAFRKTLNAEQRDAKVTMLAFLMKAVAATLAAFPDFNSSLDGGDLVLKQYYNIGFAADTPSGLMVPVLHGADRKGIFAIAKETSELAAKARDGKIAGTEMQGGTFTISSLGGIGGTSFTPIINAPEVAILGVSRSAVKPVWDGKAFGPRTLLPLSLSYDHRVIDGAKAARFLSHLAGLLADMRRSLL
jgi:pyruvate dehydrogenase E2 component (dihydrolipoamide acetyltransferase)